VLQTFARVNNEEGAARADVCGSFSFTNTVYFIERVSGQALSAFFLQKNFPAMVFARKMRRLSVKSA
jgi:hypothetical protein